MTEVVLEECQNFVL